MFSPQYLMNICSGTNKAFHSLKERIYNAKFWQLKDHNLGRKHEN